MESTTTGVKFPKPWAIDFDGMVLFCYPHNYYSQKVLMTMYEKKLEFHIYNLDVNNGEQYSEWFLHISPKGDIPVLKDKQFIIPETSRIISYLDNKYQPDMHEENGVKGLSFDKQYFIRSALNQFPLGALTIGCFIHTDLCTNIRTPYITPVREALLAAETQLIAELRQIADKRPDIRDLCNGKADKLERRRIVLSDETKFLKLLETIDLILDLVEKELHSEWLCGSRFTSLDVGFGIFIQRLYILGLDDYFWLKNKKPKIEKYLANFVHRENFRKAVPSTISTMKAIWGKVPSSYKYAIFAIGASSVALAGSIMLK